MKMLANVFHGRLRWTCTIVVSLCTFAVLAGCDALTNDEGGSLLGAPAEPEAEQREGIDVVGVLSSTFPFLNFGGDDQTFSEASSAPVSQLSVPASAPSTVGVAAQPIGPSAVGVTGGSGRNVGTQYSGDLSRYGPGPNVHLWRASLEVLSFMPMALADPVTGLIQTNWHQSAANNAERLRAEVYILSDQLRPDALRVNVYRQTINRQTGQWTNSTTNQSTARLLENQILQRANQRRISAGQGL